MQIKATELAAMPSMMAWPWTAPRADMALGLGDPIVCSPVFNRGASQTASKSHVTLVFDRNIPGTSCRLPLSCPRCMEPIQRHRCLRAQLPCPSTDAVALSLPVAAMSPTTSGVYCPYSQYPRPCVSDDGVSFPQPGGPSAPRNVLPVYSLLLDADVVPSPVLYSARVTLPISFLPTSLPPLPKPCVLIFCSFKCSCSSRGSSSQISVLR